MREVESFSSPPLLWVTAGAAGAAGTELSPFLGQYVLRRREVYHQVSEREKHAETPEQTLFATFKPADVKDKSGDLPLHLREGLQADELVQQLRLQVHPPQVFSLGVRAKTNGHLTTTSRLLLTTTSTVLNLMGLIESYYGI